MSHHARNGNTTITMRRTTVRPHLSPRVMQLLLTQIEGVGEPLLPPLLSEVLLQPDAEDVLSRLLNVLVLENLTSALGGLADTLADHPKHEASDHEETTEREIERPKPCEHRTILQ